MNHFLILLFYTLPPLTKYIHYTNANIRERGYMANSKDNYHLGSRKQLLFSELFSLSEIIKLNDLFQHQ